jgi:hypothetical protein
MWSDDVTAKKIAKVPAPARTLRVLRSFDLMRKGETFENVVTDRVLALVGLGFLEVVDDGENPSGPAAAQPGDQGGEPKGPEAEGSAGAEPGEDPRSG